MRKIVHISKETTEFQIFDAIKRNRQKRHHTKEFFVEGVRNINEAIKHNWKFIKILFLKKKRLSDWAQNIIENQPVEDIYELTEPMMRKLSRKDDPSEIIAILKMPDDDFSRIPLDRNFLITIFDQPSNKGNLGTIIRNCDALKCQGIIHSGRGVDVYDPEVISASMGSFFSIPIIRILSLKDLLVKLTDIKKDNLAVQFVGTSAKATVKLEDCDFNKPTILFIGNETLGLRKKFKEKCDVVCKIPMSGNASSLNVACAHSIMLYEISQQRISEL